MKNKVILSTNELENYIKDEICSKVKEVDFAGIFFREGRANSPEGTYVFSEESRYHMLFTEKGRIREERFTTDLEEVLWEILNAAITYSTYENEIKLFSKFGLDIQKRKLEEIKQNIGKKPWFEQIQDSKFINKNDISDSKKKDEKKYLYKFVHDFFDWKLELENYKISEEDIKSDNDIIGGVLYDSFWIECEFCNNYKIFRASIFGHGLEYEVLQSNGERLLLGKNKDMLEESLNFIDKNARLRLPENFLKVYEARYKKNRSNTFLRKKICFFKNQEKMSIDELYDMMRKFYGDKIRIREVDRQNNEIKAYLYGIIDTRCGFDLKKNEFYINVINYKCGLNKYLGKSYPTEISEKSIRSAFKIVDEYCRLRIGI